MKSYTAHLRPGAPPVLVQEGWSWGAFLFGPAFFTVHGAWVPAAVHAAALVLAAVLAHGPLRGILLTALAVLAGLMGRDALRLDLERRGFTTAHVLAARDGDAALARLLDHRPDLANAAAGPLP